MLYVDFVERRRESWGLLVMRRDFRIRNRVMMVLLMPIASIVWMTGWVLCWIGSRDERQRRKTVAKDNCSEMGVVAREEETEIDS